MTKKFCVPCLFSALLLLVVAALGIGKILHAVPQATPKGRATREEMIAYGNEQLHTFHATGIDVSSGPCLDNGEMFPGWVIDIAHSPRQPQDDEPQNQCSAYRQGRATKFIELTPEGVLIRQGP